MPFKSASMSALAYANGFTLWHYRTPDEYVEVIDYGYFTPHRSYIRTGDFAMVNCTSRHFTGVFQKNDEDEITLHPFGVA